MTQNFLSSPSGLTVQRTKSGKSAFWLLYRLFLFFWLIGVWVCILCSWTYEAENQWDCHPTCTGPPTPHVTQIHCFVHHPRCLNALYICRSQQWIQLQAMECHCLLLLAKQHQIQTGLCELDIVVELLVNQPVAGQHCGHTLWAQTLSSSGCEAFVVTTGVVPKGVQGTSWKGEW